MVEWLKQLAYALSLRFKSRARLEAENLVLRQQLNVLMRKLPKRLRLTNSDRLLLVWLYRLFPSILSAIRIVRPETVIRWHRRGFQAYWRWKSRPGVGRPPIDGEIRDLIRQMSMANPLWGAPRIHGELLMLGIDVAQSTVAKYMVPRSRRPPSQSWKTFLRNHAAGIASIDLFVVPTAFFKLLYGLVILGHERRRLIGFGVTAHPTAEWIARQVTEAFPWDEAPRYLIRDRDGAFGPAIHAPRSCDGNPRSSDRRSVTLAKRPRRAADRIDGRHAQRYAAVDSLRPLVPPCWVVISYPRNFAAPVRACVIRVFAADSSRWSSSRRNMVSRCLISSASAFGPVNPKSVSSAYRA